MMRIEIQRADGKTRLVLPGENFSSEWKPTGKLISTNGESLSDEQARAQAILASIDAELKTEGQGPGDWVKFFAKPVALLLGKTHCLSCEFRRVCLNAVKKLREKYGDQEAKKKIKELIIRSFTEQPEVLLKELKEAIGDG